MSQLEVEAALEGLKGFQRDAVEHVSRQFYGPNARTDRFLIADETGLGKSVIARGVVAETVRELQDDESVTQTNIVYICSNQDIARQNLERLNVAGSVGAVMATRLSLLSKEIARNLLEDSAPEPGAGDSPASKKKPVNLISFTPRTSFSDSSRRLGNAEERALVVLLLDDIMRQNSEQRRATRVMFQGKVGSVEQFDRHYVGNMRKALNGKVDARIRANFIRLAKEADLFTKFARLRNRAMGPVLPREIREAVWDIIAAFRWALASAGVQTLKPNLVILDEFQRFRELLNAEDGGEAAELARQVFEYEGARVLLLSATPYKPFACADEDEGHYDDFLAVVSFLFRGDEDRVAEVKRALREYRQSLVIGGDAGVSARRVRDSLVPVMTRSERPNLVQERDLVEENWLSVSAPTSADINEWVSLHHMGELVRQPVSLEYWKSVPYFVNFMADYRVGQKVKGGFKGPVAETLGAILTGMRSLDAQSVARRAELDPGNGLLRAFMARTVDKGWWKLLWLPPSMPYLEPGGPYRDLSEKDVTKHVVFSSWTATPFAVAGIMSHEAERRMRARQGVRVNESDRAARRLSYALRDDRGAGLSTLSLFWPHPGIVRHADQLQAARDAGKRLSTEELARMVRARLPQGRRTSQAYEAFFGFPGAFDANVRDVDFLLREGKLSQRYEGLRANIGEAYRLSMATEELVLDHPDLARIAAFSPGNVAYRAVSTIARSKCSRAGIWRAAFTISEGLRTLFNRPEVQALLDQLAESGRLGPSGNVAEDGQSTYYWQKVLDYCAAGNLRAVLDEYLFQLRSETGRQEVDDKRLLDMARRVADALGMRVANRQARETTMDGNPIPMSLRFAVPYSASERSSGEAESTTARQSAVRAAFNSPFAPFVLTTTSVGQEGIDFHWWSHSVVHWNLPNNPVDFEQREGRVNRYGGHAIRKNVAQRHWDDVLLSDDECAWQAAFDAAEQASTRADLNGSSGPLDTDSARKNEVDLGDFAPWWVYPGDARIQRVLAHYPLSRDTEKYKRLKASLALYRLTLGQPRQEDMVEMMQRRGVEAEQTAMIDLRPPKH